MIVPNIFNVERSNSKGYDFKYKDKRIELKTITKNGTKSCPSYMSGKDRSYAKEEHEEHIKNNHAYIFVDISNFPKTTWYVVNSSDALLFKSKRYLASKTMFENMCKPFKFKIDKKINLS